LFDGLSKALMLEWYIAIEEAGDHADDYRSLLANVLLTYSHSLADHLEFCWLSGP